MGEQDWDEADIDIAYLIMGVSCQTDGYPYPFDDDLIDIVMEELGDNTPMHEKLMKLVQDAGLEADPLFRKSLYDIKNWPKSRKLEEKYEPITIERLDSLFTECQKLVNKELGNELEMFMDACHLIEHNKKPENQNTLDI